MHGCLCDFPKDYKDLINRERARLRVGLSNAKWFLTEQKKFFLLACRKELECHVNRQSLLRLREHTNSAFVHRNHHGPWRGLRQICTRRPVIMISVNNPRFVRVFTSCKASNTSPLENESGTYVQND
jgi:hypothetical protein